MKKQNYLNQPDLEGVVYKDLKVHYSDDGSFTEVHRTITVNREELQINHSILLPGAVKAWHLHNHQDDLFYCFEPLLLGLVQDDDLYGAKFNRKVICNQSVYIPRGTYHGIANLTNKPVSLFYVVNQFFNPEDELRLHPDHFDHLYKDDFWAMSKG